MLSYQTWVITMHTVDIYAYFVQKVRGKEVVIDELQKLLQGVHDPHDESAMMTEQLMNSSDVNVIGKTLSSCGSG